MSPSITVEAGANIAFVKYWGNHPGGENLPLNPSISMTLASCLTRTTVSVLPGAAADEVELGGKAAEGESLARVTAFLDRVRRLAVRTERVRVRSENTFPTGCGIASSASGFAALAVAGCAAYGIRPGPVKLSRLARLGSGSAARSILGGFVELRAGISHAGAYAQQLAGEAHWPELRDLVVVLSREEKKVSSAEGHRLARSSELLAGRLAAIPERAARVRRAIQDRDLSRLGEASEEDTLSMHAVMLTSKPPLLYWTARTIDVIQAVWGLRKRGVEAYFTIDAGPNVHVLTLEKDAGTVKETMGGEFGCSVLADSAGPGARTMETSEA